MVSHADILNAKILVVDDKPANVLLIEGMLRVAGYTAVYSTTDPQAVATMHRDNGYDLIFWISKCLAAKQRREDEG